jgi:hypothetical protein
MIQIKDIHVLHAMLTHQAHPILAELMQWFCVRYSQTMITCAYEKREYPSVHSLEPYRAMDVRSWVFTDPQAIVDDINAHWIYDPARPQYKVALYHDMGRGAHIHLQVHDRTVYFKEKTGGIL